MRLNQYISHHSNYSRREADELIKAGRVNIEKRKIDNLATQVKSGERVFIDGRLLREKRDEVYTVVAYNKPKGELVTKRDDRGRKTIYDTLPSAFRHFIPVGRLDFASEGLLLLSDSPKVVTVLMESRLPRTYHVKIDRNVTPDMLRAMQEGIELDDARAGGHVKSDIESMSFAPFLDFEVVKDSVNYTKIKLSISEGKNRELRRFFAHFGAKVLDLKRVSYGFVSLNNLPEGKNRYLNRGEYNKLHAFMKDNGELQKSQKPDGEARKVRPSRMQKIAYDIDFCDNGEFDDEQLEREISVQFEVAKKAAQRRIDSAKKRTAPKKPDQKRRSESKRDFSEESNKKDKSKPAYQGKGKEKNSLRK